MKNPKFRSTVIGVAAAVSAMIWVPASADSVPEDLILTTFCGPELTPSPACLCAAADGTVFVGVDLNGSLGKGPGKGRIVRLTDADKDGVADSHTVFAEIDNPRGLIALGDKLWVLHTAFGEDGTSTGMDLVVLTDADRDGVADGPAEVLIEAICSAHQINSRGTDHSTNGIRMGIDGWIYIAVGDFGFHNAIDRDGTKLTLLGGGIVRVRPDGTEMELYTTGMRNIYDVAIDPLMNIFTRGNTNDGGGWNVRFVDHIQSGEYGYPRLFINFADEILPALEDLGGGSGVGAMFLSEPTWPAKYNNQPLMADWGRNAVYLHRLSSDGATFTQQAEDFVHVSQVSDLDVDGSGQMFLSAWDGAGFKGDPSKGYVVRVVPNDWYPMPSPDRSILDWDIAELVHRHTHESATIRLAVQQALLSKTDREKALPELKRLILAKELDPGPPAVRDEVPLDTRPVDQVLRVRVAALNTFSQIVNDPSEILAFADDPVLREFALRAATDRIPRLQNADLPLEPFVAALNDGTPREKAAAAIALGRLGKVEAASALLSVAYEKPAAEGRPTATQLDTIKGGRTTELKFAVGSGETLYLNLAETNAVETPSKLAFADAAFVLADNTKVWLSDLKPLSGEIGNIIPVANAKPNKKNKFDNHAFTVESPATVAFKVPDGAVEWVAKVMPAPSADKGGSVDFFASTVQAARGGGPATATTSPRHATPNADVVVPHLAAKALVRLRAIDECLAAVGTSAEDLGLWALSYLHDDKAVAGLLDKLVTSEVGSASRKKIITALARLYQREAAYDGSWWWTTRPDTRGPYYKPETWQSSAKIAEVLEAELGNDDPASKTFLAQLNDSHRLGLGKLGTLQTVEEADAEMPTVDLAKIASKQGAVGTTPVEDVILSIDKLKGDPGKGEKIFTQQGCVACHALKEGGPVLGPFMGQIGSIMNREQIATAILRPNDTISQGFQTAQITLKDGAIHMGFVTASDVDKVVLRNVAGQVTTLKTADVAKEEHLPVSMMPPGLANALSLEDFVSLIDFLASKKQ